MYPQVTYRGISLSDLGEVRYTLRTDPDPAPPAQPSREVLAYEVLVTLSAFEPATLQARLRALENATRHTEGILAITEATGMRQEHLVRPGGSAPGRAFTHTGGEVRLSFTSSRPISSAYTSPSSATYIPIGGDPIQLHNISDFSEQISTTRYSERVPNRKLTTTTLSFSARVYAADPSLQETDRIIALRAQAQALAAVNSRHGQLQSGNRSQWVRVESLTSAIAPGAYWLNVQIQATHHALPDDEIAEADYETEEKISDGELSINISGTVEAELEATAKSKIDAIVDSLLTGNRRVISRTDRRRTLDGADSAGGPTWEGVLSFSAELREPVPGKTSHKLSVSTTDSGGRRRIVYSGEVISDSEGNALSTARSLGAPAGTGLPFLLSSTETVAFEKSTEDESQQFTKVSFSYEYLASSALTLLELTSETTNPEFGDWTTSVSGKVTAPTRADALALAHAHKPAGNLIEDSESFSTLDDSSSSTFVGLNFSYRARLARTSASLRYSDQTTLDYNSMTSKRTISGSAWAPDANAADAAINALLPGSSLESDQRTTHHEHGTVQTIVRRDFSISWTEDIVGAPGHDIIEANWSIERTGQINRDVVDEIPFSTPVVQTNIGTSPGRITVSGRCRARQMNTARSWGQAKEQLARSFGGATGRRLEAPVERMSANYREFEGTTPKSYSFDFRYTYSYETGLSGLYPGGVAM